MPETTAARPLALIVDDDAGLRKFSQVIAENAGFHAETAESGAEALRLIEKLAPAIVLLDLQMPGTDGLDVMRAMAQRKSSARLIILGGQDRRIAEIAAEVARGNGLSVAASLQKPLGADQLKGILSEICIEFSPFNTERLQECITGEGIVLHYQPKIALPSRKFVGVEALLRCRDGHGHLIPPGTVLGVAEQSELIGSLSMAVFEKSIVQYAVWRDEGLELDMAVNLSASGADDSDLPDRIFKLCAANRMPPSALTIELTETAVMSDHLVAMETLLRLRLRGFDLSIDDFGTGYSSLKYLTQYRVNRLKLAQEFVFRVTVDYRNAAVVRAAIRLANELGLEVIAEGVETEAQARFLMGAGCEQAQGYYFSRPVPAGRAAELLRAGRIEPQSGPLRRLTSAA
jgi:EAL domain-containing protein (putative c-di-GMP-specific phosphodiesterase class I)